MPCRCAPALVALRNEVNARWPGRDKATDGCCGDAAHAARKSDHNANGSGYAHAHDFDEDIASGLRPLWDTLRPVLLRDARTKYVIYEARIMYPDGTDRPYTGLNAHKQHLHLSIKATATHDTRRWLPRTLAPQEDLLMAAAKDDHDARWALVLQWFVQFIGRPPKSTAEHDRFVAMFEQQGAGACLSEIVNSPEGVAYRKALVS